MSSATRSESYRWIVLFIIMLGTFMAVLVSSSVNVALPYMMSAFEVNRNQIRVGDHRIHDRFRGGHASGGVACGPGGV